MTYENVSQIYSCESKCSKRSMGELMNRIIVGWVKRQRNEVTARFNPPPVRNINFLSNPMPFLVVLDHYRQIVSFDQLRYWLPRPSPL